MMGISMEDKRRFELVLERILQDFEEDFNVRVESIELKRTVQPVERSYTVDYIRLLDAVKIETVGRYD